LKSWSIEKLLQLVQKMCFWDFDDFSSRDQSMEIAQKAPNQLPLARGLNCTNRHIEEKEKTIKKRTQYCRKREKELSRIGTF